MAKLASPVVHLVDDDRGLLRALARLLAVEGYDVETFASATEFLERSNRRRGCVVTELQERGNDGLDFQAAVNGEDDPLPVIFLSGRATVAAVVRAMKLGAENFLTKPASKKELLDAIQQALARDSEDFASREYANELRHRFARLTSREREVLAQIVEGNLNKEIAANLNTSERTIKAHRAHIMEKLQAHSAAELGTIAEHWLSAQTVQPTSAQDS